MLIVQLGSTNDAAGTPDADAVARAERVCTLHQGAVAAGETALVLTSGGIQDEAVSQNFNPTATEHWRYVADLLASTGLPAEAIIRPGLPALNTVDEALMVHEFVAARVGRGDAPKKVVIVTSDFHCPRVRHLFGVAFGRHAGLEVPCDVECVPAALAPDLLAARCAREKAALTALRKAPFGTWLDFIRSKGLEACNRSLRHSRYVGKGSCVIADMPLAEQAPAAAAGPVTTQQAIRGGGDEYMDE